MTQFSEFNNFSDSGPLALLLSIYLCPCLSLNMSSFGSRDSPYREDICCVIEDGDRCINFSTQVTFSKKMKSMAQKKHNLVLDPNVGIMKRFVNGKDTVFFPPLYVGRAHFYL